MVDFTVDHYQWDLDKERLNIEKHKMSFSYAIQVFRDPAKVIIADSKHSLGEKRWFCFGRIHGQVITVRFTYRQGNIRLIGAGAWRKGKKIYEKEENQKG